MCGSIILVDHNFAIIDESVFLGGSGNVAPGGSFMKDIHCLETMSILVNLHIPFVFKWFSVGWRYSSLRSDCRLREAFLMQFDGPVAFKRSVMTV